MADPHQAPGQNDGARDDFIISEDALIALVAAIRAADEVFESGVTGGGGTRHYVRDCLLPELEKRGLRILLNPEPDDA